jgi:hypothetical protein
MLAIVVVFDTSMFVYIIYANWSAPIKYVLFNVVLLISMLICAPKVQRATSDAEKGRGGRAGLAASLIIVQVSKDRFPYCSGIKGLEARPVALQPPNSCSPCFMGINGIRRTLQRGLHRKTRRGSSLHELHSKSREDQDSSVQSIGSPDSTGSESATRRLSSARLPADPFYVRTVQVDWLFSVRRLAC